MGPGIEVVLLTKGLVFQRLQEHRKVSEGKDHFSRELRKLSSRLNETKGDSLKTDAVSESVCSNLNFLKMMFFTQTIQTIHSSFQMCKLNCIIKLYNVLNF